MIAMQDRVPQAEAAFNAVMDDERPAYAAGVSAALDLLEDYYRTQTTAADTERLRWRFAELLAGEPAEYRAGAMDTAASVSGILAAMRAEGGAA